MGDQYPSRTSIIIGALQIIFGAICIILNAISIGNLQYGGSLGFVGHGIWNGILFIVTGSIGCGAAKLKTKCMVVSYMVLCIISASFTIILLSVGIVGALVSSTFCRFSSRDDESRCSYYKNTESALQSCLAIIAVTEAVLGIYGAVICCKSGVCCCATTPNAGVAHYSNNYNPNSGMMFVTIDPRGVQIPFPGATTAIPYGQPGSLPPQIFVVSPAQPIPSAAHPSGAVPAPLYEPLRLDATVHQYPIGVSSIQPTLR